MAKQGTATKAKAANPLGSPVLWGLAGAVLWALTAAIPQTISAALSAKLESLSAPNALIGLGALAGAGLVLGVLWRGALAKTALGITLFIVLLTAFGAYLGAGPIVAKVVLGGAKSVEVSTRDLIVAGAFAVQSAWFVLAFSIRRVNQKSAWWLVPLGGAFAAGLAFIP